jgi:hypothetical protein
MWLKMVLNRVIASSKRAEAAQRQHERGFIEFWKDMADDLGDRPALRPDVVEFAEGCLWRAFATLPARERAVMRLYFLEGASPAAIGAIYGRHHSQIPLWTARGRELMRNELREQVQRALGSIRESELGSLLRMMHDEIDVTISTLLASSAGASEADAAPADRSGADEARLEARPPEKSTEQSSS